MAKQVENRAIVFVTYGSEEMEAVISIDVLRRAGIHVLVMGVNADDDTIAQYDTAAAAAAVSAVSAGGPNNNSSSGNSMAGQAETNTATIIGAASIQTSETTAVTQQPGSFTRRSNVLQGVVTCSRKVRLVPDAILDEDAVDINSYGAVIVPGGLPGARILAENDMVQRILADFYAQGKIVASICAGPLAIKHAGIHTKKGTKIRITSHPSVRFELEQVFEYCEDRVVIEDHLITSRGPGTALEFALQIVRLMKGEEVMREVAKPMMINFEL